MKRKRIGDVLIERGSLVQGDLDRALVIQQEKNLRLGEVLMQNLHISKSEVASAIEQVQGVEYAACPPLTIPHDALALIPRSVAVKCSALPLEISNNKLVVAMAEPQDLKLLDELRFRSARQISPRFSFRDDILAGIRKFYDKEEIAIELVIKETEAVSNGDVLEADVEEEAALTELEFIVANSREENREVMKELKSGAKKRNLAIRFISMMLSRAAHREATHLHVEPGVSGASVRMNVDGLLREALKIPSAHQAAVISRIKMLADMDNADQRLPQEGRFLVIYRGRRLDIRISTLPTYFGEKVLLRILDPRSTLTTFDQLGVGKTLQTQLRQLLDLSEGMVVVTGPTGSGKSTTLYAAVNAVCAPSRNIIAVEDPIEYMLEGVTQVQVNESLGLTVADCLKPILRQNPNIVMIDEIRDKETAQIALRAAQTGHLILTTLHTNDSLGVITRLRDFLMPSYLISSITGIVGQRLLRTLCSCRREVTATRSYLQSLEAMGMKDAAPMYQPAGCDRCEGHGFHGRTGVFELLEIDGMMRDAIQSEASSREIRGLLSGIGFRTMQSDALDKVVHGVTTLDEMMRVVPLDAGASNHCHCGQALGSLFRYCPACGNTQNASSLPLD